MSLKSGDDQNPFTGNCKMTDHRRPGLELAEYIALGLTLLTLMAMGAGFLPLFLLVVTFGLNILNRLRERTRQLQRLTEITGHLQEQWEEEKEALSAQIQSLSPAVARDNDRAVATRSLRETAYPLTSFFSTRERPDFWVTMLGLTIRCRLLWLNYSPGIYSGG